MDEYTKNWIEKIAKLESYDRETLELIHKKAEPIARELHIDTASVIAMMLWRSMYPTTGQIYPR